MTSRSRRLMPLRKDPDETQKIISDNLSSYHIDPHLSYTNQVFTILRDTIVQGRFLPGLALSEATISKVVGISRTPVREAVRMLSQRNLVDIYPQAGTIVAPIRLSLLNESKFIRGALERENAVELARVITQEQIDELNNILKLQEQSIIKKQRDLIVKNDDLMHRRMLEFTNRSSVWELVETVRVHIDRVRYLLIDWAPGHSDRVLEEHKEICRNLANHDSAGVSEALHANIDQVSQDMLDLRERAPSSYFVE